MEPTYQAGGGVWKIHQIRKNAHNLGKRRKKLQERVKVA